MADKDAQAAVVTQTGGGLSGDLTNAMRAQAEDARQAEINQLDETVPGGRYEMPDGTIVNAYGEPVGKETSAADLERLRREHELGVKLVR